VSRERKFGVWKKIRRFLKLLKKGCQFELISIGNVLFSTFFLVLFHIEKFLI
jgi:hypothetical protein